MRVLQGVKGLGFRGPGYADGLGMFWAYLDGRPPQTVKRRLKNWNRVWRPNIL